jgi:beta-fructofuranosidase
MYLYYRTGSGFTWGHASSKDLLHWRHHPDAIGPGGGKDGVFSGGAFVDDQGSAFLSYVRYTNNPWENKGENKEAFKDGTLGIGIVIGVDEHFDKWEENTEKPAVVATEWGVAVTKDRAGKELIYGTADPSQIWMKDGKYYMLAGNRPLLVKYGLGMRSNPHPDSLRFQGDHLYLFVSNDLKQWEYLHDFYESDRKWTTKDEDNMCPSFLPLPLSPDGGKASDKHLLLFISHPKGCQYYVGEYKDDRFYPENHGRMTWVDNAYFAPEALMDGKGRQIMWAWIFDDRTDSLKNYYGWTGTYGLPRSLWLGEDGTLRMRPVKELEALRQEEQSRYDLAVKADSELELNDLGKELLELEIIIKPGKSTQCGVIVNSSKDGREQTRLYYDALKKELVFDATKSSIDLGRRNIERGPFELPEGEPLRLRVFIDKSIVEVYANDRQAIARRVYPKLGGRGIKLFAKGGDIGVSSIKTWEMMPSNPY